MIGQNEVFFVTARITISLPFRIDIKEGDLYEAIAKLGIGREAIVCARKES